MIVIVDYGMGNLGSIANMLKKVGAQVKISSDKEDILGADKLILPGVGAFDNGMNRLVELGLVDVLNEKVLEMQTPILGLCLGMQLFSRCSQEGKQPGLGWIRADVHRFQFNDLNSNLKIPHMGWNYIQLKQSSPLLEELPVEPRFYFVHSYHLVCQDSEDVLATTHYGYEFPAAVVKGNIYGMQCHPEKSHKFGMRVFQNFIEKIPC